jgi:Kef-type K+ transport system membrane component KefB
VLAGLLGPLLAAGRRPRIPILVGELIGGAILGRTGLQLIDPHAQPFPAFSSLGFAMLMLEAGTEVDVASPQLRDGSGRGGAAFALTLAAGVPVGLLIGSLLGSHHPLLFVVLLAGSSAAVAFPAIEERGLGGSAVAMVIAWITLADALTALLMPLTVSGSSRIPLALLGDALIAIVAAAIILAGRRVFGTAWAQDARRQSKQRSWALRLRLSVLMLLVLGAISEHTGASLLVAGFAAGIVLRQFREPHRLALELTGLASGFFVPVFFVLLGASLDLRGLLESPQAIVLALAMAVAATAVHLLASLLAGRRQRVASGLLASAQLGLPAAAASLALSSGALSPPLAAAVVAGGLLTLAPATAGAILLSRDAETQAQPPPA